MHDTFLIGARAVLPFDMVKAVKRWTENISIKLKSAPLDLTMSRLMVEASVCMHFPGEYVHHIIVSEFGLGGILNDDVMSLFPESVCFWCLTLVTELGNRNCHGFPTLLGLRVYLSCTTHKCFSLLFGLKWPVSRALVARNRVPALPLPNFV